MNDPQSSPVHEFVVNGTPVSVRAEPTRPLLTVLHNDLGLLGTRFGCGLEQCGACMVLVDGVPEFSCSREIGTLAGKAVVTVEGLSIDGTLHAIQKAVLELQAGQCGYCLSGIMISAAALLARNPRPSRAEVTAALDRHLCRCGMHNRIIAAVQAAGTAMAGHA